MPLKRTKFRDKKFRTFKFGDVDNLYVSINGIEINASGITIDDIITSEVNTASFTIYNTYANKPLNGQVVEIWNEEATGNVKIFAGRITGVIPIKISGSDFSFQVDCTDYTKDLDKNLVAEQYTGKTAYEIISDILSNYTTGFTMNGVSADSPIIQAISFNYVYPSECFTQLANLTGYDWYVDYDRDVHFVALDSFYTDAPIEILDAGINFTKLEMSYDNSQIRNRVYVRGGDYLSPEYTEDTKTAAASQTEIGLKYQPSDINITIDGVTTYTIGIQNADAAGTHDFLVNYTEKLLKVDNFNGGAFTGGEIIIIKYKYFIPVFSVIDDLPSQSLIKSIEGGDGVYESIVIDKNITTLEAARQRGQAELLKYSGTIIEGQFSTMTEGFRSGQKLHVKLTDRNLDQYFLVKEVIIENIGSHWYYTITFATLLIGFSWFMINLLDATRPKDEVLNEILDRIRYFSEVLTITDTLTSEFKTPPFNWSADDESTPNRMIWSEFTWG